MPQISPYRTRAFIFGSAVLAIVGLAAYVSTPIPVFHFMCNGSEIIIDADSFTTVDEPGASSCVVFQRGHHNIAFECGCTSGYQAFRK